VSLFIHDSVLGHVPNPGFRTSGFGNSFHTIDADGLRFTGEASASSEGAILAVGDSFTYGDEVLDEEAWPAQLQRLTGRRVLNGGVTGYGFDQVVLRAEQLMPLHKPSVVIVSFIAGDVWRTEWRRLWWRDKAWFAIEGDELVLKGVPVPDRARVLPPGIRRRIDGILVDLPFAVQQLVGYFSRAHRHGRGLEITRRLIERVARWRTTHAVEIVVMAQWQPDVWTNSAEADRQRRMTHAVLDCAAAHGLACLDTFQRIAAEPNREKLYARGHMSARGNLMVASLLAAALPGLLAGRRK